LYSFFINYKWILILLQHFPPARPPARPAVLPLVFYPSWHTVKCTYVFLGMGAAYLGFFFILSHIFEDAKALSSKDKRVDWAEHQIESSSNLCGWKLAYVCCRI
jgi:hypothetical protein